MMIRRVFASSVDGQRLSQLSEEIAQVVNPHCWFNLKDVSKLEPKYWDVLDALRSEQQALMAKPMGQFGVG